MDDLEKAIVEFFTKSRLPVIFAGAGVSAHAGLPTWEAYLRQIAQSARTYDQNTFQIMDDAVNESELEAAAAYYNLCRKIPTNEKWSLLAAPLQTYDSAALATLSQLPATAYVTTNFDRAFLDAWSAEKRVAPLEANLGDPTLARAPFEEKFFIARIHGRVEIPEEICLTADALQALPNNPDYVQLLTHVFTRRQVLFVGFSFLDPAIRQVLSVVTKHCGTFHHGRHLALLPSDSTGEFIRELESHSIRRITYDPTAKHASLWKAIAGASHKLRGVPPRAIDQVQAEPFSVARRYLATSYARMRLGPKLAPLRQAIVEGIVAGLVQKAGHTGITISALRELLRAELTLEEAAASELTLSSIHLLVSDKLCTFGEGSEERVVWCGNGDHAYETAIGRLTDGAVQRYCVREGGIDTQEIRSSLTEFFRLIVLQRGWDLGAAFASHSLPERIDVEAMMKGIACFKGPKVGHKVPVLARSVADLLTKPDDEEAALLAQLGRLAFGLELVLEAPHDAGFYAATLPERIYLDANVLMPAITSGHPHQKVFSDAIEALQTAASSATMDVGIFVYSGFLNEIVSHRRLALEEVGNGSPERIAELERLVRFEGTANANVYIGAFFNLRVTKPDLSFADFLKAHAPYRDESELQSFLRHRRFRIVGEGELVRAGSELPKILGLLDATYADQLARRRKSAVVIRHDAVQLAGLADDIKSGKRSIFVSADRALQRAFEGTQFSWLGNAFVSHVGLTQLVDLLVGGQREARGLTSLLWATQISAETSRIRNHLVDMALREHDASLTKVMHEVVGEIAEDMVMELERRRLSLNADGSDGKEVSRTLERYEKDFFRKMRLAAESIQT
jgi:hypothetical protein